MFQTSDLAEEVVAQKNQIAELEEEKGNLQLKLVDHEEILSYQGDKNNTCWIPY